MNLSVPSANITTNKELFGYQHIETYKAESSHPQAKFRTMKENHKMIMAYTDPNVHAVHSQAWEESSDFDGALNGTSGGNNNGASIDMIKMSRTRDRVMAQGDAPIAIGRSGERPDVGINASGLLGERLLVSDEPSRNTYVQRTWLPHDDPALIYKTNGVPIAPEAKGMSLDLGDNSFVKSGWVHQREATYTGQPLSKVGARRAGVFADEYKADGSREPVNPPAGRIP
jgi:hypothetical protein